MIETGLTRLAGLSGLRAGFIAGFLKPRFHFAEGMERRLVKSYNPENPVNPV
jgi:hypothetical protein